MAHDNNLADRQPSVNERFTRHLLGVYNRFVNCRMDCFLQISHKGNGRWFTIQSIENKKDSFTKIRSRKVEYRSIKKTHDFSNGSKTLRLFFCDLIAREAIYQYYSINHWILQGYPQISTCTEISLGI